MRTIQDYDQIEQIPMGLGAGNTRTFNISKKLCLRHPFTIMVDGNPVNKRIKSWIDTDAAAIYQEVYNNGTLSLARDAYDYLMDALRTRHFSLYVHIQFRKAKRQAQRNVHRRIASGTK